MSGPITVERLDQGAIWRVTIGGSKGNIIDRAAMEALQAVFAEAGADTHLAAIVLEGQGAHFSFGASVPEHTADQVAGMLQRFGTLLVTMVETAVPIVAAVRGQCLGGGLEVVSVANRIFATPDARLGQPEIVLGVFAPYASVLLPWRIGRGHAEDLCLSGRSVTGEEALGMGLVDELAPDPAEAALAWVRAHLLPKSASSVRFAVRAVRADLRARLATDLPAIERLYLDDLMKTSDANEGLQAFMEKRSARWRHA